MDINKIHVTVDKHDYVGLYWITEEKGYNYLNISYNGLVKISRRMDENTNHPVDYVAKKLLSEIIENMK